MVTFFSRNTPFHFLCFLLSSKWKLFILGNYLVPSTLLGIMLCTFHLLTCSSRKPHEESVLSLFFIQRYNLEWSRNLSNITWPNWFRARIWTQVSLTPEATDLFPMLHFVEPFTILLCSPQVASMVILIKVWKYELLIF